MIKNILKIYSFLIISFMGLAGFLSVDSYAQITSAILFYPMLVYMWLQIVPKRKHAIDLPVEIKLKTKKPLRNIRNSDDDIDVDIDSINEEPDELALEGENLDPSIDIDRRAFVKLIGSAGLSVFMLAMVTKRAQAAFFGSVPGPGTVALKDSSGNQIDPAEKQPTDGYRVVQLDDSSPAYYGFQNKTGAWFIMKEDSSGNYRYTSGASNFTNATTGWPNRAALTYDYFEAIF